MSHQFKADVFQPFFPCPMIMKTLETLRGTKPYLLIINGAKIQTERLRDVFYQGTAFFMAFKMGCCITIYFCVFHEQVYCFF